MGSEFVTHNAKFAVIRFQRKHNILHKSVLLPQIYLQLVNHSYEALLQAKNYKLTLAFIQYYSKAVLYASVGRMCLKGNFPSISRNGSQMPLGRRARVVQMTFLLSLSFSQNPSILTRRQYSTVEPCSLVYQAKSLLLK